MSHMARPAVTGMKGTWERWLPKSRQMDAGFRPVKKRMTPGVNGIHLTDYEHMLIIRLWPGR
jgi:hypothetical protein